MKAEDLDILVQTADKDKDGKISLEDFRSMIETSKPSTFTPFRA